MSSISDHLPHYIILENLQSKRRTPNKVKIRVNNKLAKKKLCESVGKSHIMDKLNLNKTADPNSNYNLIEDILKKLYEFHFPTKTVSFNNYTHKTSKWITIGIINSIKHKDKLYRKQLTQTAPNDESYTGLMLNFRTYKNILNRAIRNAKCAHYTHVFDQYKTDSRITWDTIKQLLSKRYKQFEFPDGFNINGVRITNKHEIAQQFNNFFVNIGSKLAETISTHEHKKPIDSYLRDKSSSTFICALITRNEVISIINQFDSKKVQGMIYYPLIYSKVSVH